MVFGKDLPLLRIASVSPRSALSLEDAVLIARANRRYLYWAGFVVVAAVFFWLRINLSSDLLNMDEVIATAVSKTMSLHGNLDANWASVADLPTEFRTDQYNFYSYNLLAHALLLLFGYDNDLLELRLLNIPLQAGAIVFVVLALRNEGRRPWEGLLAAGLLAVAPALVQDAHIARTESFLYLLLAFVLWCASLRTRRLGYVLAGFVIGLGTASKLTFLATGLVLAPALIAATLRKPTGGLGAVAVTLIALCLGFAAGAPYAVIHPQAYISGVKVLMLQYGTEHPPHSSPRYHAGRQIGHALEFILILYGPLIGIVAVALYRRMASWLAGLALMSVAIIAYFGLKPVFFERNIGLALMGLVVLAGACLRSRVGFAIAAVSAVVMFGWSLPIASASKRLDHRRLAWQETRVGEVPILWPFHDAAEQLESCHGVVGFNDYGDPYSHAMLKSAVDQGFYPMAHYVSIFHVLPTSTLQVYLDGDVVYFFCRNKAEPGRGGP